VSCEADLSEVCAVLAEIAEMVTRVPGIVSLEDAREIVEDGPIPLYFQLIQLIEQKIQTNAWRVGWSLPSEQALCDHFGLSRNVVRQALADLQLRGVVFKQNGKRTEIAQRSFGVNLIQRFTGFHEEAEMSGQRPQTRVLEFRVAKASPTVAEKLRIPLQSDVILLTRLRSLLSQPQVYVESYLNFEHCHPILECNLTNKSLYRMLRQRLGLMMVKGIRTIRATSVSAREAKLLHVAPQSPALMLTSVGFLADGTPLEYFVSTHRGDTSEFEVQVIR
jgi:GntR family transcriptional regulator